MPQPSRQPAPGITLLYVQHGVAVVGLLPGGSASRPPTLLLSTDLVHWRDITPPAARRPADYDVYAQFESASFLDPTTGWVTAWNEGNLATTIYRTSDAGKTWTSVAGAGHGMHAGDSERIQLLTPQLAFDETIAATAPKERIRLTTNGGRAWRVVYAEPPVSGSAPAVEGPFEMPTMFATAQRGFGATGIPAEPQLHGGFYTTNDGGTHWSRVDPPIAGGSADCGTGAHDIQAPQCAFGLPVTSDGTHLAMATEVPGEGHATVGFDTSGDGGRTWQLSAHLAVTLGAAPAAGYPQPRALVSLPSPTTWWVDAAAGGRLTTWRSTDGGTHWSSNAANAPSGVPTELSALDATRALIAVTPDAGGTPTTLYATTDGGRAWHPMSAATPAAPPRTTPSG